MINGQGKFLPESQRNYPSPMAAFFNIAGLSTAFSRIIGPNRYHSPGGDSRRDCKVEILSGAFMMIRRESSTGSVYSTKIFSCMVKT